MDWVKRGNYSTVTEYLVGTTKESVDMLRRPAFGLPTGIAGIPEAAALVWKEIDARSHITIVGDYDSDGLNATAILVRLFRYLGVEPDTVIPRRISDGYGLSSSIVDRIKDGLVITIDNGIAAIDEIKTLKEKGCRVIVMDHHLPGSELPPADILVDPQVDPEKNQFHGYCGAGLGYLLAVLMLRSADPDKRAVSLRQSIAVHAALATITDAMPVIGPNRRIVKDGLAILNGGMRNLSPGLAALCSCTGIERYTEDSFGFTIGPIINATARLYNRGGESVLKALVCDSAEDARAYAAKMIHINEKRKELTAQYVGQLRAEVDEKGLAATTPIVVVGNDIPEGLIGLVAGALKNEYKKPVFVFSHERGEAGLLRGSGRANTDMGEDLAPILEAIRPLCVRCGGHSGAAGLTVREVDILAISRAMQAAFTPAQAEGVQYYDLEIGEADIPQVFQELESFAPYGNGCPAPVVLIRGYHSVQRFGSHYRLIGKEKDSVRVNGVQSDIFGYQMAGLYADLGYPDSFDVIGTIGGNTYNGRTTIQVRPVDFRTVV